MSSSAAGGSSAGTDDEGSRGRLVVLCGRSFSGKSTVAAYLAQALKAHTLSFDAINESRGLHGGEGIPLEEWARTGEIATERVRRLLVQPATVVVDDTSSPRFLRDGWRSLADELDAAFVLVFIDAARETILRRQKTNRVRGARPDVTDAVMAEHLASFEPPAPDEDFVPVEAGSDSPPQVIAAVSHALNQAGAAAHARRRRPSDEEAGCRR